MLVPSSHEQSFCKSFRLYLGKLLEILLSLRKSKLVRKSAVESNIAVYMVCIASL